MPTHCMTSVPIYSDSFRKEVDDVVYEVDCAMITVKQGADVDIGILENSLLSILTFLFQVPIHPQKKPTKASKTAWKHSITSSTACLSNQPPFTRQRI